jgi:D-beta-D-heptose 7-phosphate kinase/D-beta-D-heptose 1-phosphate adenosyltransferase
MFSDSQFVKAALIRKFPELRLAVIGDVMLDRYLEGTCERISPEAPVPVIKLGRRTASLGGAANVARNLASLSVRVELFGVVGNDQAANEVRRACEECGIGSEGLLSREGTCTITKTRVIAEDHQLLRIDEESSVANRDEDSDRLIEELLRLHGEDPFRALILSDYAKGVCTPYLCSRLISACREHGVPVYVDPKGTDYSKYKGATSIKPNRLEMMLLAQTMGWNGSQPLEAAGKLCEALDLEFVALTLGAQGMAIIRPDGVFELSTAAQEVFDVSGAGDTVIATLVAALCAGVGLNDAAMLSNLAAADVTAQVGCVPVRRERLLMAAQAVARVRGSGKLLEADELKLFVEAWRGAGLKLALTNGCFDLLHAGHVRLLEDASASADRLIVAVNSDGSVKRLKGPQRPLMPVEQRVEVLSALECVDGVVVFEEDTPIKVIEEVRPDVLIKGGDYDRSTVVGADVVESYGGSVVIVPLVRGLSSTSFAEAISKL